MFILSKAVRELEKVMKNVEERLAELEREVSLFRDQIEIRQLIASYGPVVDTSNSLERSSKLANLWVEDGVYDIGGVGRKVGRDAIAHAFEAQHFGQVQTGVCHFMGLPHVRITGDRAVALHYSCVFRAEGEGFYPWRVSANRWDVARIDGKWKVETRTNRLMTGDIETVAMLRAIDLMVASEDSA